MSPNLAFLSQKMGPERGSFLGPQIVLRTDTKHCLKRDTNENLAPEGWTTPCTPKNIFLLADMMTPSTNLSHNNIMLAYNIMLSRNWIM